MTNNTQTTPVSLGTDELEALLADTVRKVLKNLLDVRAGTLTADEAAERDDAAVRSIARILMNEDERFAVTLPACGPQLVADMRENIPALFHDQPAEAAENPRAAMVHAARVFQRETYTMLRACLSQGECDEGDEKLAECFEGFCSVWLVRFTGGRLRN